MCVFEVNRPNNKFVHYLVTGLVASGIVHGRRRYSVTDVSLCNKSNVTKYGQTCPKAKRAVVHWISNRRIQCSLTQAYQECLRLGSPTPKAERVCYFAFFKTKTAWKRRNLGAGSDACPLRPLKSTNEFYNKQEITLFQPPSTITQCLVLLQSHQFCEVEIWWKLSWHFYFRVQWSVDICLTLRTDHPEPACDGA